MTIYTLRMPKLTSGFLEAHIFPAKPGAGKGCICQPKSLCRGAATAETTGVEQYMCLTKERMLARASEYRGDVCAECLLLLHEAEPL